MDQLLKSLLLVLGLLQPLLGHLLEGLLLLLDKLLDKLHPLLRGLLEALLGELIFLARSILGFRFAWDLRLAWGGLPGSSTGSSLGVAILGFILPWCLLRRALQLGGITLRACSAAEGTHDTYAGTNQRRQASGEYPYLCGHRDHL